MKLIIVRALIKICETTTNPNMKLAAKRKLKELSEIPETNIWDIDAVARHFSKEIKN